MEVGTHLIDFNLQVLIHCRARPILDSKNTMKTIYFLKEHLDAITFV